MTKDERRRISERLSKHLIEGLAEVGEDIVDVLDAHTQADEVGGDAGSAELLVGELAVGVTRGVEDAALGIGHVGHDTDEAKRIDESDGFLTRPFQTEGNDTAAALR